MDNLRVEYWPLARLIPYVRNPRRHDEHVDRMAGMIREFGFRVPVLAKSDGSLIDGHLRLKAAQRLELAEVPVIPCDDLTDSQIRALRILVNKSVEWAVKKVSAQHTVHLTEKPVELAARALQYSTRRGEHVLDLFGGSGSTLIGAEQTDRRAFLMELDALYCDVIIQRWQEFTGQVATLEETGQPSHLVAQERAVAPEPASV